MVLMLHETASSCRDNGSVGRNFPSVCLSSLHERVSSHFKSRFARCSTGMKIREIIEIRCATKDGERVNVPLLNRSFSKSERLNDQTILRFTSFLRHAQSIKQTITRSERERERENIWRAIFLICNPGGGGRRTLSRVSAKTRANGKALVLSFVSTTRRRTKIDAALDTEAKRLVPCHSPTILL